MNARDNVFVILSLLIIIYIADCMMSNDDNLRRFLPYLSPHMSMIG